MAKLYWRVKKDGKWTWKPAECAEYFTAFGPEIVVLPLKEDRS